MVCAFQGWNDAGDAASAAGSFLSTALAAQRFAKIDGEDFYDFQSVRPRIRLLDGQSRKIIWPSIEIREARVPLAARDLVIVEGNEPSMHWRSFCAHIVDLAEALGVEMVVTLGALLADVPHSHPVAMTAFASDPALVKQLGGMPPSNYEGPTGIVGVLHAACADAGLPSVSLWASVPHYVAAAPNPKAALALVRKLETLLEITVDATELESSVADYERQVALAVQSDPEIQAFVERLERAAETEQLPFSADNLPSGDLIARDFQRFLRQQRGPEDS
jgi:proteasome assembly chaperone (PAC2) family protein